MPDQPEAPKRTIDERLDALTMNLELLYRDHLQLAEESRRREEDSRRREEEHRRHVDAQMAHTREMVMSIAGTVENLIRAIDAHERRITTLERAS